MSPERRQPFQMSGQVDPSGRLRVLHAALGDPTPIRSEHLRPGSPEALAFALSEVDRQMGSVAAAAGGRSASATDAFGLNPLVARARAQDPGWAAAAAAKAPAPTMFAGGDLPPWTASGLDPALLTRLPWNARHTAAAMPSQADAYRILQAFDGIGSDDAEAEAAEWGFADHPGCQRYADAVQKWLLDAVTKEQQDAALYGSSNDQKAMYGLLFGDR